MACPIQADIIAHIADAGDERRGLPMGAIVDAMVLAGHRLERVEQVIWTMLARRLLTPSGFVCRVVRRRDSLGELVQARSYEFLLVPWTADMDRQLELADTLGAAE